MREPNEISEDEYLDRIQRDPARWEQAHDMADLIHDRQVEDALLDFDDDRRNEYKCMPNVLRRRHELNPMN